MPGSFPPDVVVLDSDALIHARIGRGRKGPQIVQAKSYRLPADTFVNAVVTPQLTNEAALADALRRLRVKHEVLSRSVHTRVLVLSAMDQTLSAIEKVFEAAGIEIVLIEPIGLNIWNAITVREPNTTRDRIFFYIRDGEFTTAAFRGSQPLFIRSRNLNGERTIEQEIKLSASYIRDTLRTDSIEQCYLSGNVDPALASAIGSEFSAPVRAIALADFSEQAPEGVGVYEAELTACTGVFTS